METAPQFIVSCDRLEKPRIEPVTLVYKAYDITTYYNVASPSRVPVHVLHYAYVAKCKIGVVEKLISGYCRVYPF